LVEVGLHDPEAGVGKVDGFDVSVAGAAKQVGKTVKAQIERVLDRTAYATIVSRAAAEAELPITAESEAEKPTRSTRPALKAEAEAEVEVEVEVEVEAEAEVEVPDTEEAETPPKPTKKKTRRGSRGGRGRKKKTAAATPAAENGANAQEQIEQPATAKIHVPDPELGLETDEAT